MVISVRPLKRWQMGWNRKRGVKLLTFVGESGWEGGKKCHFLVGSTQTKSNMEAKLEFFNKALLSDSGWINAYQMVKTAQKSAKPCPKNVGKFLPTHGSVHSARPSSAISPRRVNGSQPNFPCRRQMSWNRIRGVRLLKSIGGQVIGKNDIFGGTCPH